SRVPALAGFSALEPIENWHRPRWDPVAWLSLSGPAPPRVCLAGPKPCQGYSERRSARALLRPPRSVSAPLPHCVLAPGISIPEHTSPRTHEAFDARNPRRAEALLRTRRLPRRLEQPTVEHLHCSDLIWLLAQTPLLLPGISDPARRG